MANAKSILSGGSGVPGLVLWIGDSLTRDAALGTWAQSGAGKTADDQMITSWMHAGASPQGVDSIDGFALATPYFCSARSYTVGDSLGAWDFMGTSMPTDTNPVTARQKLQDCATYPRVLNLRTMLAALPKAQFAIPEVNLEAGNPEVFTDLERMVDLMIANHIVPVILTYTYRTDAAFNLLVDRYNTALIQYAQAKKLPLIDLNREMLARLPFAQWPGRFLSDGVHYTHGTTQFPAASDPYANGGDPATPYHRPGADLQRLWPQGLAWRPENEGDQATRHRRRHAATGGRPERRRHDGRVGTQRDHCGAARRRHGDDGLEHDRAGGSDDQSKPRGRDLGQRGECGEFRHLDGRAGRHDAADCFEHLAVRGCHRCQRDDDGTGDVQRSDDGGLDHRCHFCPARFDECHRLSDGQL